MKKFPINLAVPEKLATGIGYVMIHWAYQERYVAKIIYRILATGPKQGRIAVRSPRIEDQMIMIRDLLRVEQVTIKFDLLDLMTRLKKAERDRDLLAHGLWVRHPSTNQVCVQDLSGNWRPDPNDAKISRRIKPEAVIIDLEFLKNLLNVIKATILDSKKLFAEIDSALPRKPPQQTEPDHHLPDQNPKKFPSPL